MLNRSRAIPSCSAVRKQQVTLPTRRVTSLSEIPAPASASAQFLRPPPLFLLSLALSKTPTIIPYTCWLVLVTSTALGHVNRPFDHHLCTLQITRSTNAPPPPKSRYGVEKRLSKIGVLYSRDHKSRSRRPEKTPDGGE